MQNPIETNYKLLLDKLIKAKSEIEHYERKIKEQEEELNKKIQYQEEAKYQAEKIIKEANENALKIIEDAKSKAEAIKDQTFKKAYDEGYKKGIEDAAAVIQNRLNELEEKKIEILKEREEILKKAEKELLEIIPKIVEKVLENEIENKQYIVSYIKNAIDQLSIKHKLTIKVSEDDLGFVQVKIDEIVKGIEGIEEIEVKADKALKMGDVVIQTPYGFVETGLSARVNKIQDIIRSLIGD